MAKWSWLRMPPTTVPEYSTNATRTLSWMAHPDDWYASRLIFLRFHAFYSFCRFFIILQCLEDGTWGYEKPTCKEITCDEPDLTEHLIADSGTRSVGDLSKFSCPKGRYLVGNETRTCLKNGHWSGKSPVCKAVDCERPNSIENGRIIIVNDSTLYGGSVEYHCVPNFNRIGPYLRKCMDDGKWSGEEPRCELAANDAQEGTGLGTTVAVGAVIIIILLILLGLIVLHRNKARPVKNTENVQAAERKEDQNAAVMSYSSLEHNRRDIDLMQPNRATFNTFHPPNGRSTGQYGINHPPHFLF